MERKAPRPRRVSRRGAPPSSAPKNPRSLASGLDPGNAEEVLNFGLDAQRQMLEFYDRVLDHVRGKDTRNVREQLQQLVDQLKTLNVTRLREHGLLSRLPPRLPWFRNRRGTSGLFAAYEQICTRVEYLAESLEEARRRLLRDAELFDKLYDQDRKLLGALDVHIGALELKLTQLRKGPLIKMQQSLSDSADPMDQHRLEDFTAQVERLERKDRELKLARNTGVQVARQIRMFQSSIQALVEGIQATVLNSVPLWKNHIAIAVSRLRQQKTLKLQAEISRTTSKMLKQNSDVLLLGAAEISAETLREIATERADTLEESPVSATTYDSPSGGVGAAAAPANSGAESAAGVPTGESPEEVERPPAHVRNMPHVHPRALPDGT